MSEQHEHQWNWIDLDAQRCIKCGLRAQDYIAALEAENARMRVIVAAVADLSPNGNDLCSCYHHDESRNFAGQTEEWIAMGRPHQPGCIYTKARALLASDGNDTPPRDPSA